MNVFFGRQKPFFKVLTRSTCFGRLLNGIGKGCYLFFDGLIFLCLIKYLFLSSIQANWKLFDVLQCSLMLFRQRSYSQSFIFPFLFMVIDDSNILLFFFKELTNEVFCINKLLLKKDRFLLVSLTFVRYSSNCCFFLTKLIRKTINRLLQLRAFNNLVIESFFALLDTIL